ncbi:uncharacterized protein NMK_3324 [Novimethylophilus kurashikiensis]|uniref:Uncharacterized protein n=1 Tax=Novimethylophilus kurashikiensis TaxID=1825523 RepID=A0A2R5FH30_9PROT|nr:hypothetical protein [Novimethylophilus kurashikiensis]GBG15713.1 uncharacterized protein NMK_3324 [Novimethylophilus kurashikiensis]
MDYAEFFHELEISIRDSIRTCYPYSWDENHISFTLTENLFARHRAVSLEGLDRPFKILWDVRKLRLPEEVTYGDIGVIVRLTTWAGETLEGVGLLEAKKRDIGKNTFSATKSSQLKRIISNVPSARLMLYDYDNVSSCMDNWSVQFEDHYYRRRYGIIQPFTHCVCLPAGIAVQQGKFSTELHKFGVPLSYQLVGRYFRGFDLELDPAKVQAVKNNALRHGGPRIIYLIGVSTGTSEPILPEVNSNLYVKID